MGKDDDFVEPLGSEEERSKIAVNMGMGSGQIDMSREEAEKLTSMLQGLLDRTGGVIARHIASLPESAQAVVKLACDLQARLYEIGYAQTTLKGTALMPNTVKKVYEYKPTNDGDGYAE